MSGERVIVGDVIQVLDADSGGDRSLVGCFVLVTAISAWGIQGFVPTPRVRGEFVHIRHAAFARIGRAAMVPTDDESRE